jgi:hypothetical protein
MRCPHRDEDIGPGAAFTSCQRTCHDPMLAHLNLVDKSWMATLVEHLC